MTTNDNFNIYQQTKPTNEDLIVTFTPDDYVIHYTYKIFRDDEIIKVIDINNNRPVDIMLSSTGQYQIEVIQTYQNHKTDIVKSGEYIIDKEKPTLIVGEKKLDMPIGAVLDIMGDVRAFDKQDGDLLKNVKTNYEELDFKTPGLKTLTYTVSDSAGNMVSSSVYINVYNANYQSVLTIQYIILFLIVIAIFLVNKFRKSMMLEKRVTKYSIDPIRDTSLSLFDKIFIKYKQVIDSLTKTLSKSVFLQKHSKKFDKYIGVVNDVYDCGITFLAEKIIVSISFFMVAALAKIIQYKLINMYEAFIPITLGYFLPNLIYFIKYQRYRKSLENDFLQAVTIMNNAFKSGRSIVQAIELVTTELDGPISREFRKMHMEINLGLSVDVVFKRFAKRIDLIEATYLTVSLTILNTTGGNIIKVFSSIEKTLFNKKKLKLELKALTSSSKIIISILLSLPLLFIIVVNLINPSYFYPFYTTKIGGLLVFIMMLIYVSYIYVVQRVIKIRM